MTVYSIHSTPFIDQDLLIINEEINIDPILFSGIAKLFEWANEMGRKNVKVNNLDILGNGPYILKCRVYTKKYYE
jgi:hypothetical protein